MNRNPRAPYAEAHKRARAAFWQLTPEQRLARMRQAGIVGETPHIGDKVRVLGLLGVWHYGIVVGADTNGQVSVVHNTKEQGVVLSSLVDFADGQAVEMVQRAPAGREFEVAERAMSHLGKQYDLFNFNCEHLATHAHTGQASSSQLALGGLLAAFGLAALAVVLAGDTAYDGNVGRYRDARGRFARS